MFVYIIVVLIHFLIFGFSLPFSANVAVSKTASNIEARHACSRARFRYIARLRKPINGKIAYDSLKKTDTRSDERAMQRSAAIECIRAKRRASPVATALLLQVASCYEGINFFFCLAQREHLLIVKLVNHMRKRKKKKEEKNVR